MNQEVAFEVMGAALQTVTAQVGLWPVTRGDASHLDCRPGCIPRMSHAAKIGFNGRTISLGLDRSCRWRPGELHRTGVRRRGGTAVPVEENRAVARRVLDDLVSQGRLEVVDQIYAQAFEFRDPTAGQTITTYEGIRDLTRDIRTRTPDIVILIEEEIAEGDAVVHRWTASGHDAATGRFWTAPGISIYHLQAGRVISEYVVVDRLGLLRQVGMAPVPGTPST